MSYHYKMVSRNEPEISNLLLSQEHDLVTPKHSTCAMVQVPFRRGCRDYAQTTSHLLSPEQDVNAAKLLKTKQYHKNALIR